MNARSAAVPRRPEAPPEAPIRLMIVDDSAVARAVLARMAAAQPDFEVAALAANARAALDALATAAVDLVLRTFERSEDLWVCWYPMFSDLRNSQQFVDIVDDIGLVRYWDEYGFNDFCARGEDGAVSCR